ncbi:hypothetical protein IRY44_28275 [Micromonospora sp. ANENR4]|uniref:condensation domain-containing protein n=1 Tax=unclassified Micromonospora TaxID=2617518 RepID=UPI00188DD731|nr:MULTISPECIES: condensation domain-containing protein [unclassified Micromonospora]MBF5033662.1 hypothetical protein [Micromonospora sp. ANENR4]MCZ7476262.1 condensation domain-containing protein [Micromonospora sp. WMMC273]
MAEHSTAAPHPATQRLLDRRARMATRSVPPVVGEAPLSFGQERLWIMSQIQGGTGGGGLVNVFRLCGRLDRTLLDRALTELHLRHDILRTVIGRQGGTAVQRVIPPAPVTVPVVDVSGETDPMAAAHRATLDLDARPYRLDLEPGIRWLLCRLGPDDHVLALVAHHIIIDGWSEHILRADLSALLVAAGDSGPAPSPAPRHRYAEYAVWQRARLAGAELDGDRAFWRRELAGAPPAVALPFDRDPDTGSDFRGGVLRDEVPADVAGALADLAAACGVTRFMAFLTAFAVTIGRAGGQSDFVVGAPAAGRTRPEWEELVGFFITPVPIRIDLSGPPTFRQLLARVRERCLAAMSHQELPLEHIVADLRPRRVPGRQPMMQVMFQVYEMEPIPLRVPGVEVTEEQLFRGTSSLDLSVSLVRSSDGFSGYWEYRGAVFDAATVARMRTDFYQCVRRMCDHPDEPVPAREACS